MALKIFVVIFVLGDWFLKTLSIGIILANRLFKNIPFFINRILESLVNHMCFVIEIDTFDMV